MDENLSELSDGELCLKVRKRLILSQLALARYLKTSRSTISHVEVGKRWNKFPDDEVLTREQRRVILITLCSHAERSDEVDQEDSGEVGTSSKAPPKEPLEAETAAFRSFCNCHAIHPDKAIQRLRKVGFALQYKKKTVCNGRAGALVSFRAPSLARVGRMSDEQRKAYTWFMDVLRRAQADHPLPKRTRTKKEAVPQGAPEGTAVTSTPAPTAQVPAATRPVAKKRRKEPPEEQMELSGVITPAQPSSLGNGPPYMSPPPPQVTQRLAEQRAKYEEELRTLRGRKKVEITSENAFAEIYKLLLQVYGIVGRMSENITRLCIFHNITPAPRKNY